MQDVWGAPNGIDLIERCRNFGPREHRAPQSLENDENDTWILFSDQYLDAVHARTKNEI